jgi:hypothetical protein
MVKAVLENCIIALAPVAVVAHLVLKAAAHTVEQVINIYLTPGVALSVQNMISVDSEAGERSLRVAVFSEFQAEKI